MRRIGTIGWMTLCLVGMTALQAHALTDIQPCQSDDDCQAGWECLSECDDPTDSAEPSPGSCEGVCVPESGMKDDNACEVDADCPTGFECVEAPAPGVLVPATPATQEEPCAEGEDCGDEAGASEESKPAPPEDEDPPAEPTEPTEAPEPTSESSTYKHCAVKMCETDEECGGDLVCVLEVYDCMEPAVMPAPMPDCAEGEDCGDPDSEMPMPEEEECVPETVGHCAPKWLAPCEANADCGAGFSCVEEELCWGSSVSYSGSSGGAGAGAPPAQMPCDPDDEDCADAGIPAEEEPTEEEPTDEESFEEECETTGEFYCELEIIDCSTESCPEGLTCVPVPEDAMTEDCATSSDGEMSCPESDLPPEVCVPEDFEDWVGHGGSNAGSAALGTDIASNEESATTGGSGDNASDEEAPATSSGGGDSGCAGGQSGAPLGALVLTSLAMLLATRRRA